MFRTIKLLAVTLAFVMVVLSAYARISDAGLGCPNWPGCYGQVRIDEQLHAMQRAVDATTLEPARLWAGLAHRHLPAALAGIALLLLALSWRLPGRRARAAGFSGLALLLTGLLTGWGYWGGAFRHLPLFVAGVTVLGFLVFGVFYALHAETGPSGATAIRVGWGIRWLARVGFLILVIEIALGAWTTATFAGSACPDFPTCLGSAWPDVDYAGGFDLRRYLSAQEPGAIPSLGARAAIHWVHRLGAALAFVWLSFLALNISSNRSTARLSRSGVWLNLLLFLAIGLGIAAVLMRLPVIVTVAHAAVAALLLMNVVHLNVALRRMSISPQMRPETAGAAIGAGFPPPVIEPAPLPPAGVEVPAPTPGVFERLRSQLGKTRGGLTGALANLALGKKAIDRELLEEIEEKLLLADLGVNATTRIIDDLTRSLERHELRDWDVLNARLRSHLHEALQPCSVPLVIPPEVRPFVILVVGVNGVGKTTTIGKLAKRLQNDGHSVMLAAGDTFRAAAVEQLQQWGERNQIAVIAQQQGADSASVIYDGVQAAQARSVDVLIADTAGRLHTKLNLMEELRKIKRIIGRVDETAPHEILLVVDAGTGQNAISQAKQFNEAVGLTGIALTKLDGTAKGGVIFALAGQFGIPIRYIGIGEGIDDLQDFDADRFIEALFQTRVH